jgi:acylphosphatase
VHNAWDGSVELEAQGTQEMVHELMKRINQSAYIVIDDIRHKPMPVDESERGFHVR